MSYKTRNITSHHMRYTVVLHDKLKNIEVKTHLNISSVKLPVTPRVNPPYLRSIHRVEKYTFSGGVIHSLTNNANMVD